MIDTGMSPRVLLVLFTAVAAVSGAGTLVRLAPDVHPLVIAFWRTSIVAVMLSPWLRRMERRDAMLIAIAGLCLAGHFWAWFSSLGRTTVMRSTLLVCLTPIWAGMAESLLGESRPARFWAGIAVAIAGVVGMAAGGSAGGSAGGGASGASGAAGDGLALLGGLLGAAYFVTGRDVRRRIGIGAYGAAVCGATALWLVPAIVVSGAPVVGFDSHVWTVLIALALGPQLLGHIGFNYAVGYLPAAVVAAVILLEPVGATLIAASVLKEVPTSREIAGGCAVLLGVAVATAPIPRLRPR